MGTIHTLVSLAVGAAFVALELYERLESLAVLLCSISSGIGPPRHGGLTWIFLGEGVETVGSERLSETWWFGVSMWTIVV
jgi:hypothetical protein